MQALAEFIMRGRWQAALVAVIGSLFPFVSPAAVGLVTLRQGRSEGLLVAMWAALPIVVAIMGGELNLLLPSSSAAVLLVVVLMANLLAATRSWQLTLVASAIVATMTAALLPMLMPQALDLAVDEVRQAMASMQQQQPFAFEPGSTFIAGLFGWVVALLSVLSLLLARWWQALLYNPGGFQGEFHQLRLDRPVALILALLAAVGLVLPMEYAPWTELAGLPLLFAGIALVHCVVARAKIGGQWLGLVYFGLFFIGPVSMVLAALGLADSMIDLRSRLPIGNGKA